MAQLNPEDILKHGPEALQALRVELAKRSLLEFTKQAWHVLEPARPFVNGWPIEAMCEHLEAVDRGEITKLLITIPPGSMKSRLVRVLFPLWRWTKNPHLSFIGASYALRLAIRDNFYSRTMLQSDWYRNSFGIGLSEEQGGKEFFQNTHMGGMLALSVGGQTTGYRGDCNLADDLHNVSDGESDAIRSETVRWFAETFQNRVNDLGKSPIIVVMQRVHEEDVASAALDMGYEHLKIQMRFDPNATKTTSIGWTDPRRHDGELMWPARFPAESVDEIERNIGAYAFASQYQQTPVPRKGGLFAVDNIKVEDELPDEPFIAVRAWDLAASEGAGAYTVGILMLYGQKSDRFYIADVKRKQLGAGGVRELIEETAREDGHATKIMLPQDPGQAGKVVVQDLIAMLTGYNARAEAQSGDKATRAAPFAAQMEIGRISVLNRTWTRAFLDELRFFPKGKFKDQVDASASAFNALAEMTRIKERKKPLLTVVGERQENYAKLA